MNNTRVFKMAFAGVYTSTDPRSPKKWSTERRATVAALADGTLNINASFIDLENQVALANFEKNQV